MPCLNDQNSESKCEEFAQFFKGKVDTIRSSILITDSTTICDLPVSEPPSMTYLNLVTDSEISATITKMKSSTCSLDPIPTKLFKSSLLCLSNDTTRIVNTSLQSGIFPAAFKTALVKPLLKKPDLNTSDLASCRPISNLPFIIKLLEKIVFNQLFNHLNTNNLLDKFQSGYRTNHSMETALL